MLRDWLSGIRRYCLLSGVVLVATAGLSRAGDNDAELRALIELQGRQIQELKQQVQANQVRPVGADAPAKLDDEAKKTLKEELKNARHQMRAARLVGLKDKGLTLSTLGETKVEGMETPDCEVRTEYSC